MSTRQPQVILVRHANAEWPAYAGVDFERPLTPQGLAESRSTAVALRDAGHRPKLLLTSSATRTLQTAEIIATTLGLPDSAVRRLEKLYNAGPDELDAELRRAFATVDTVLLVAHNPGVSELARALTGSATLASFRTAQWMHIPYKND